MCIDGSSPAEASVDIAKAEGVIVMAGGIAEAARSDKLAIVRNEFIGKVVGDNAFVLAITYKNCDVVYLIISHAPPHCDTVVSEERQTPPSPVMVVKACFQCTFQQ